MINKIDLSGEWDFSFNTPIYNDKMTLPSTTAMARKGELSSRRDTGYLTELYPFSGTIYYRKKLTLPKELLRKKAIIHLERTRCTTLIINGKTVGSCNSLIVAHEYDITEYLAENMTIEISVSNDNYPIPGGHLTSPDTQTNWIGILGVMELRFYNEIRIINPTVTSNLEARSISIAIDIDNSSSLEGPCTYTLNGVHSEIENLYSNCQKNYSILNNNIQINKRSLESYAITKELSKGRNSQVLTFNLPDWIPAWSEHSAYSLELTLTVELSGIQDTISFNGSVKDFKAGEHDFIINGIPTKLRGKHDGLIFPLTGAAPTDVNSWLCAMGTAVRYGINHYRFHTCCPPKAAFVAADLLGIYMEPELPFWGTIAAEGEEGYVESEQKYLIKEGLKMLDSFGNHPSFCMMSMGNELWGSRERINEIIGIFKKHDARPLYTEGSNNFQFVPEVLSNEDFFVGARLAGPIDGHNDRLIRGSFATCDAPLGVIQTKEPSTSYNFDKAIMGESSASSVAGEIAIQYNTGVKIVKTDAAQNGVKATVPIVSHEIGQYFIYPDYSMLDKYTGVLQPYNIKAFEDTLKASGRGAYAAQYAKASGSFSIACYREELEMMHRSRYMAGYQVLDIQDFTGQGTALVGVLDAFMESKGLISEKEWRNFCADTVILAEFDSYNISDGSDFVAQITLSNFNPLLKLTDCVVTWKLSVADNVISSGEISIGSDYYGTKHIGSIKASLKDACGTSLSARATLSISIDKVDISNSYNLWIYKEFSDKVIDDLIIKSRINFVNPENNIKGFYCTDFWNYIMFKNISESVGREVAVGTLGLLIDNSNPLLSGFECELYSTPQWYKLITNCNCAILDEEYSKGNCELIVQMIDNPWRNHALGIIYRLDGQLYCTIPLEVLRSCPEGRVLLASLCSN